jgi:hypothetical protein
LAKKIPGGLVEVIHLAFAVDLPAARSSSRL